MPRSVSTARTRSPALSPKRSAMAFGRVALTDPPAFRSVTSFVMLTRLAYQCRTSVIAVQAPGETFALIAAHGTAESAPAPALSALIEMLRL